MQPDAVHSRGETAAWLRAVPWEGGQAPSSAAPAGFHRQPGPGLLMGWAGQHPLPQMRPEVNPVLIVVISTLIFKTVK